MGDCSALAVPAETQAVVADEAVAAEGLPDPRVEPATSLASSASSASGRDALIGRLFDEHYPGLCRLAALLLGDRAAAEEAVQEAFLRTYAGWWRIRRPEQARWYLRRAVVNQCRSRQRRRVSEDRGNRVVHASERDSAAARDEPGRRTEALVIADAVRALPPRQREAVVLRYFEDLSEADIATVLGCSEGTVKSQLSKARTTLARLLDSLRVGDE
jgi:RNA polymerase sigma-70 factor (sigma-E family)